MSIILDSKFLFPVKVTQSIDPNFDSYKDDLIEWIENYKLSDAGNIKVSNIGGWQSSSNFYVDNESFSPFMDKIWQHILSSIIHYSKDIELSNIIENGNGIKLSNIWINVNPRGAYNQTHVHPGSLVSGVMWVKVLPKSGNIVMYDPNEMNNYCLSPNVYSVTPREGVCLLFPSYIPHRVFPNESESNRISLSFNLDIS